MAAALAAYALAQAADVYTTLRALKAGGVEKNLFIKWLMDRIGRGWVLVKLALSACAAWIFWSHDLAWAVWGMAALVGGVSVNNLRIAKREERK